MSQPAAITYLQIPTQQAKSYTPPACAFHLGQQYYVHHQTGTELSHHNLISDYRFSLQSADVIALSSSETNPQTCYLWDTDTGRSTQHLYLSKTKDGERYAASDIQLHTNRLLLNQANLSGPDISLSAQGPTLTLSPQFNFTYHTDAFDAELGMIHLVQAQRFVVLENGEQHFLFDSGDNESVLYLADANQHSPLSWCSPIQQRHTSQTYSSSVTAYQLIPEQISGQRVHNLTVLEKYTSFVMQRANDINGGKSIWIPILTPINWGWSIRAGCRSDGEWAIMRRKVMLPTSSDEGLQFPLWQDNNHAVSQRLAMEG